MGIEIEKVGPEKKIKRQESSPKKQLSPEVRRLLEEEMIEAEIRSAVDHAREEGFMISREEAVRILLGQTKSTDESKNK